VIERKFIEDKVKEHKVKEWLKEELIDMGYSHCELEKTPLGTKVTIYSFKPGMVVGRGGENIARISQILEEEFKLESPHIEVKEVEVPELDPVIMANRIAKQLANYGVTKFKAIGHRNLQRIMEAGAIGAEIIISGKVPSARAKSWRFYSGYLPKCGEVAKNEVKEGFKAEKLKIGVVGVTVRILPPGTVMPDRVEIKEGIGVEEVGDQEDEERRAS